MSDHSAGPILGLNAVYHQPSAALVANGRVIAAVEEERFSRRKGGKEADVDNTLLLPFASIQYVLDAANLKLADVERVAISFSLQKREEASDLWTRFPPILGGNFETPEGDRAFRRLIALFPEVLAARFDCDIEHLRNRIDWVPHHLSHLASAFYPSPFEDAAGLVIDGIGEDDTTTLADCSDQGLHILETVDYPHSLGFLWEVLTSFLGFQGNHDESKIMGLAAYGDPTRFLKAMGGLIRVMENGRFQTTIDPAVLHGDFSQLETLFGMSRRLPYEPLAWQGKNRSHADLAAALQEVTNLVFLRMARHLRNRTGRRYLVLAGGVALNCVANGLVAEHSGFDDVYVQPAAGDAGTAVGAALFSWYQRHPSRPVGEVMPHPFLGPSYSDEAIRTSLVRHRLHYQHLDNPIETAVDLLTSGNIIGWFQGRMEFGPRALGNRSLLANPMLPGVRPLLNIEVKHREEFRPFCPTILAEHVDDWVEHSRPLCQASRHMLATYRILPEKRPKVPAIIHQDGSSRLQLLFREDNPLFHDLISVFYRKTGIPMLLNTSFNDQEPIVCSPNDACRTWLKTTFSAMIIGNYLVSGLKPWVRNPDLSVFEREAFLFDSPPASKPSEESVG